MADPGPPQPTPNPSPPPKRNQDRDFLLHLESYLAHRDGVDKLLKISRYTAKLLLSSSSLPKTLTPNLKSFDSSVGLSRKAFRLGKFVQDLNSLRLSNPSSPSDLALVLLAYGGEGVYYFIEQLVWLSKTGLISPNYAKKFSKISAWAELIGYVGSITMKVRDLRELRLRLELVKADEERGKLEEKVMMKTLSIVQDLADAVMAVADVRDGKGAMTGPTLMASAGLVSAVISTHKNWKSC
ncbi:uncharacterized protein A4U43_C07F13350 [Asparagus officinalis]|uniref:Uncharacterized protein n=1 Tax=Asparagus officinalis TaxID=4686 RepID=A0A5P1EF02_ASPOF|nr:peroxisomal membrane protein 11A [Asparagus officinalis]XP_020275679.1 peroxisomal membrane protein 11A [Asparagus officinalis]XP_020275680.1 peroxisomal membrane protein 11A [Asparagus officinalis]ONK63281.1 uncharacterized protein A4U43_C07F13350 [Asparagus officinalis]